MQKTPSPIPSSEPVLPGSTDLPLTLLAPFLPCPSQSLTAVDADGWGALHYACAAGHEQALNVLLKADAAAHGGNAVLQETFTAFQSNPLVLAGQCALM